MSEHRRDDGAPNDASAICPTCGTPSIPGDRFCAACGRFLPQAGAAAEQSPAREPWPSLQSAGAVAPAAASRDHDPGLWILGAKPAAVIAGGLLLLLLAAALLVIGQRDETGTIVMLSICVTPLALIVTIVGLARALLRAARRQDGKS